MQYKGKLYGKISTKYFDTGKTADDYDNLEFKTSKEHFLNVLEKRRLDTFNNELHKLENKELQNAIEIINRLIPPSYF